MKVGLAMMLPVKGAKPKGKAPEPEESEESSESDMLRQAFQALKDDDEDGFVSAMQLAVESCCARMDGGETEEED